MSYKVILTLLDKSKKCEARTLYAIDVARQHDAHLLGIAPKEVASTMFIGDFMSANSTMINELQHSIDIEAEAAVEMFSQICANSKFESFEGRTKTGSAAGIISSEAMGIDLIVLSQHLDPDRSTLNTEGLIEHSLQVTARPILIVPALGEYQAPPKIILIGWRDSRECSHAIRQSIPLLQHAENVEIVEVSNSKKSSQENENDLGSMLRYLRAHDVNASFSVKQSDIDPANFLLSYSCDAGADALVMGGYGHARIREWALGGMTRTILETMTLPVLMAH